MDLMPSGRITFFESKRECCGIGDKLAFKVERWLVHVYLTNLVGNFSAKKFKKNLEMLLKSNMRLTVNIHPLSVLMCSYGRQRFTFGQHC